MASKVEEMVAPKVNPSVGSSSSVQQQNPKNRLTQPLDQKPGGRPKAESEGLPEWKLKCLHTEYGVPPTLRGSLHMGGCF